MYRKQLEFSFLVILRKLSLLLDRKYIKKEAFQQNIEGNGLKRAKILQYAETIQKVCLPKIALFSNFIYLVNGPFTYICKLVPRTSFCRMPNNGKKSSFPMHVRLLSIELNRKGLQFGIRIIIRFQIFKRLIFSFFFSFQRPGFSRS